MGAVRALTLPTTFSTSSSVEDDTLPFTFWGQTGVSVGRGGVLRFPDGFNPGVLPIDLVAYDRPVIAAWWHDVEIRTDPSALASITYGATTIGGRDVWAATWRDVGVYDLFYTYRCTFQIVLWSNAWEINYDSCEWSRSRDDTDPEGVVMGYFRSANDYYQHPDSLYDAGGSVPYSVNVGPLIDGGARPIIAGSINSTVPGRYRWPVGGTYLRQRQSAVRSPSRVRPVQLRQRQNQTYTR